MALSVDDSMYKDICLKIEVLEERIKAIEATEKEKITKNGRKNSKDFFKKSWKDLREFYGKPMVQSNHKYFKSNFELAENDNIPPILLDSFSLNGPSSSKKNKIK